MVVEKKAYKLTTKLALEIIARRQIRPDAPNTQPGDVGNGHVLVIDERNQKFNGITYHLNGNYYYACVKNKLLTLHIEVWAYHNGAPPEGYCVHHEHRRCNGAFDRQENNIEWLFLLTNSEHTSYHKIAGPYVKKICQNPKCGKEFITLMRGKLKKFCCADCREAVQSYNSIVNSKFITPEIRKQLEYAIENEDHSFVAIKDKMGRDLEQRICYYCHRPFKILADSPDIACSRRDCKGRIIMRKMAKRYDAILERNVLLNVDWHAVMDKEFGKLDVVVIEGEAWLIGKQVATLLGYKKTSTAIQDHVKDADKKLIALKEARKLGITGFSSPRGLMLINEFGLIDLFIKSNLSKAKMLRRRLIHELIPSFYCDPRSFFIPPPTSADYISEEEMQMLNAFSKYPDGIQALIKFNALTSEQKQLLVQLIEQFDRDNQPTMIDVTPDNV